MSTAGAAARASRAVEDAIEIVAKRILGQYADDVHDEWENYPEIGADDWEAVVSRVQHMVGSYDHRTYLAAYDLLAARAEK